MIIEKEARKRDTSTLDGTVTPKQARQVLNGLTASIVSSAEKVIVSGGGDWLLINAANFGPSGRASRYDYEEVLALRDCLILLSGFGKSTNHSYAPSNDPFYYPLIHHITEVDKAKRIKRTVTPHLKKMNMEIVPAQGGMLVRKKKWLDD